MFKFVKKWYAKRELKNQEAFFRDGYDWVAGELLRGKCVDEVESYFLYNEYTPFDRVHSRLFPIGERKSP